MDTTNHTLDSKSEDYSYSEDVIDPVIAASCCIAVVVTPHLIALCVYFAKRQA